jgi:hypothetical protein
MSFLANIANAFFPKNNILITVSPYNKINNPLSGFVQANNFELKYTVNKGTTIKQLKNNINKYRSPKQQVNTCYISGIIANDNLILNDACNVSVSK